MSKHTTKMAEKTIEAVLVEFLEEQQERLKPSTMRKYEDIIHLFRSCLNNYAYQSLDEQEEALFDGLYYYNAILAQFFQAAIRYLLLEPIILKGDTEWTPNKLDNWNLC